MELFIQDFISSNNYDDLKQEDILERRISPYATLRPGDLAALLKLSTVPIPLSSYAHGSGSNNHSQRPSINTIFEKKRTTSTGDSDDEKNEECVDVVCNAADNGHVPTLYVVKNIKQHEMPVIGFFVDKRICPGFRYKVRRVNSEKFFWNNEARCLESIGTGYGARLTFSGDKLNYNENYFWSDSNPEGFAFSIQAVDVGQKFLVQDSADTVVGEAVVERFHGAQAETSMSSCRSGVTKHVSVTMTCKVTYYQRHHHGLKELWRHTNEETVSGEAVLHRPKASRKASLTAINKVYLPRVGQCSLLPDC
ncbi:uncharacterized protein LOC131955555 [Physella acuta]|uniref:uncharacterized protein LOC131955555 n=1 Tax=Physella acuta TaxID=109671 RepID=UPI0027DDC878|nr:uncharacterized protein LOC131955555 [Physella acuta]